MRLKGTGTGPGRRRRNWITEKPNISLNLWSVMKNCIGKELSKIPMPVSTFDLSGFPESIAFYGSDSIMFRLSLIKTIVLLRLSPMCLAEEITSG